MENQNYEEIKRKLRRIIQKLRALTPKQFKKRELKIRNQKNVNSYFYSN